jgi:hypothetical protein
LLNSAITSSSAKRLRTFLKDNFIEYGRRTCDKRLVESLAMLSVQN